MDIVTYALAKKYTEDTANALGAVKGAPCTIQSITETADAIVVIFSWTGTNGATQTSTMTIPKGKSLEYDWRGTELGIRVEGDTNYEYVDLKGDDGASPTVDVQKVDKTTTITVTNADGTSSTADILDGSAYESSPTAPTTAGTVGEIVFNSAPEPGGWIGWVYTLLGWYGFGEISVASTDVPENAYLTADGQPFILADGSIFLYADS